LQILKINKEEAEDFVWTDIYPYKPLKNIKVKNKVRKILKFILTV